MLDEVSDIAAFATNGTAHHGSSKVQEPAGNRSPRVDWDAGKLSAQGLCVREERRGKACDVNDCEAARPAGRGREASWQHTPQAALWRSCSSNPQRSTPLTLRAGKRKPDHEGLRAVRLAALLACMICAILPEVSAQEFFNPMYQFEGQVLSLCNDLPTKVYDENGVQVDQLYAVGCTEPFIEPQVVTTGQGRLKACTHDSKSYYHCPGTTPGGCSCFGSCLPNIGFPPECLDVVFALEDTWGYLGIYIHHGPGAVGQHLPFPNDIFPAYHLFYKLTVSYGDLDLLGTLSNCTWVSVSVGSGDPEEASVDKVCNILPASLPGEWGSTENAPYHVRYKQYLESNFIKKKSLEISGRWEQLDRLIRLVQYKARWNENSNRIRSPVYNKLTYDKSPNELMLIEIYNLIDVNVPRVIARTER